MSMTEKFQFQWNQKLNLKNEQEVRFLDYLNAGMAKVLLPPNTICGSMEKIVFLDEVEAIQ